MRIGIYAADPEQVIVWWRELKDQILWAAGPDLHGTFPVAAYEDYATAIEVNPVNMVIDCVGDLQDRQVMVVPARAALYLLASGKGNFNSGPNGAAFVSTSVQLGTGIDKIAKQVELIDSYSRRQTEVGVQLNKASAGIRDDLERTSHILDSITRIAKRSKIIGLNSAIEASRVGEQGRGFAVVAEEIKTLADDSAQAIQNIEKILTGIQRRSDEFSAQTNTVHDLSDMQNQASAEISAMLQSLKELGQYLKQLAEDLPA